MPSPAGAIVVMLPLYVHFVTDLPNERLFVPVEIAYVALVAFLMASRIPHFSGKRIGRVPREWFIPLLLGVIATLLLIVTYTMQMLIVVTLAYLALIQTVVKSPSWQGHLAKNGWVDSYLPGDAFRDYITAETKRVTELLTTLGLIK